MHDAKMPLKGAGLSMEGPKDSTSMRNEPVQTVSSENADFRPGRTDAVILPASEVKVMGK